MTYDQNMGNLSMLLTSLFAISIASANSKLKRPGEEQKTSNKSARTDEECVIPAAAAPSPQILSFEQLRIHLLKDLPDAIKKQRKAKTYARDPLIKIRKGNHNSPILIDRPPPGFQDYAHGAIFYPYYSEGLEDYPKSNDAWGCAWRAIQTVLTSYQVKPEEMGIEKLFHLFGPRENLKAIYEHMNPGDRRVADSHAKYDPYQIEKGWADPWVGQLILYFFGISSKIEIVNKPTEGNTTPENFYPSPHLNFTRFRDRLLTHFKENPVPVMIDDGEYAWNIVGVKQAGKDNEDTVLWIADPHVIAGSIPKSPTGEYVKASDHPVSLYQVTLNKKGEQISASVNPGEMDQFQAEHFAFAKSSQVFDFENRGWFVLFPGKRIAKRNDVMD